MQTMFLQVKPIVEGLKKRKSKFQVIKTDLNEKVPEDSVRLWTERGFKPVTQGTAYVKFEGRDKVYVYPLFFDVEQ